MSKLPDHHSQTNDNKYKNNNHNETTTNNLQFSTEQKLDNLESIINENTLRLLQQKDLLFRQNNSLQLDSLCKNTRFTRRELKWLYTGWKVACTDGCGVSTDTEGLDSYG